MDEDEKRSEIDRRAALDARDWIVRLTSGNVSVEDLARFKVWRNLSPEHRRAFERERAFWQQLQALDRVSDDTPSLAPPQPVLRGSLGRRAFLLGGGLAAASAAAMVAAPRFDLWWRADFTTTVGDQAEFSLPDGSVAMLNTDSAIAVDFTPQLRLVELLKGEAEFRVRQDNASIFRVAALGGNSDALGTDFTVKAIDGVATVTVSGGHVRVTGPAAPTNPAEHAASIDLMADEQTYYLKGERPAAPSAVDTGAALAWRTGRIVFDGWSFSSAIAELDRYLPERIVMTPGVDTAMPVSAIFSTREALAAVQALARTQGRSARRIPGVMILIA